MQGLGPLVSDEAHLRRVHSRSIMGTVEQGYDGHGSGTVTQNATVFCALPAEGGRGCGHGTTMLHVNGIVKGLM